MFLILFNYIIFTITPAYPTNTTLEKINDILSPSFFVMDHYPFLSKVVNNYVAFASLFIAIIFSIKQHKYNMLSEVVRLKFKSLKITLFLFLCFLVYLYTFFGYAFDLNFFRSPLNTYRFHYFYDNKLGFFISSWLSLILTHFTLGMFFARIYLFFNPKEL